MSSLKVLTLLRKFFLAVWQTLGDVRRDARKALRAYYHAHLAKYGFFRGAVALMHWTNFKLLQTQIVVSHRLRTKSYALSKRSVFAAKKQLARHVFSDAGVIHISGPKFIGNYEFRPIGDAEVQLEQPQLDVLLLTSATVMGGTNYTLVNGSVMYPDEYNPVRDVCPAELNKVAKINLKEFSVSLAFKANRNIDKGISLLGCCTGNYAHWLSETLPKILIADTFDIYDGYPLLIDSWVHPNFIDSIKLLATKERDLIFINRWEAVEVKSLVDVSPPAYTPPEFRIFVEKKQLRYPASNDFPFLATALNLLRTRAHQAVNLIAPDGHNKIFLYRSKESSGNDRLVKNIHEIEALVRAYGYEFIDPAKLSFKEQVLFFSTASHVVSPLGAAMSNLIFSPPGCKVLGLSPYYENANYYYFSNLMGTLGHELHYVLGPQTSKIGHPLHREYEIDLAALKLALDSTSTREE